MDELNNSQLVLLNILVSFVTAIATGVLTVSLMTESPQSVTQTIYRVAERTIERVVPGETKIKEVPIVITEEDMIVKAITQASSSIAAILQVDIRGKESLPIGTGFFLESDLVVAVMDATYSGKAERLQLSINNQKFEVASVAPHGSFALLKIGKVIPPIEASKASTETKDSDTKKPIIPLKLSAVQPAMGQTVIGLGSISKAASSPVSVGIISNISSAEVGTSTQTILRTNASTAENAGGPLLNIKGEVVGLNVRQGEAVSAKTIKSVIDAAL